MGLKKGTELRTAFETYAVAGQIGSGGAGEVYRVTDSDGRDFAIKILNKEAADAKKLKRFRNEINFCSKPISKNVIQIADRGLTASGETFYVMPLYSGTLHDLIQKGIQPGQVLRYFGKILDGIEAAHLLNTWHRDIKPRNILYDSQSDELIVADFGIARFEEEMILTAVETSLGDRLANFSHCAPEQKIRGAEVGPQADIYALGLILNEMFTGQIPAGTQFTRIGSVSPEHGYLDELVDKMLRQSPRERPTVAQVKSEIIARGADFLSLQKLDRLRNEVIAEDDIDDPTVLNPIRAVRPDFQDGMLILELNQDPPPNWIRGFQNPQGSWAGYVGAGPGDFRFNRNYARVPLNGGMNPQVLVNHAQNYLQMANDQYAESVREQARQKIATERARQKKLIDDEERRRAVLSQISL